MTSRRADEPASRLLEMTVGNGRWKRPLETTIMGPSKMAVGNDRWKRPLETNRWKRTVGTEPLEPTIMGPSQRANGLRRDEAAPSRPARAQRRWRTEKLQRPLPASRRRPFISELLDQGKAGHQEDRSVTRKFMFMVL